MKSNLIYQSSSRPPTARAHASPARAVSTAALINHVKSDILSEFQADLAEYPQLLRLALIEAEALAWQTDYPHLLFPALAAEKAQTIANWRTHQEQLKQSPLSLAA